MGSTRLKSRRRQDQGYKWARITIAILATLGVIDTGSITLKRWGLFNSLSCPGNSDGCDKVLNSSWGTIFQGSDFTIPLSFLGLLSYLTILLIAIIPFFSRGSDKKINLSKLTWWGLFLCSCGMSAFSILLLGLMVYKIQAFCFFCVLSAVISISIFSLSLILILLSSSA